MQQCTLTVIDTRGIQDYIFGSNRLRENVGASYLVAEALGSALYSALDDVAAKPDACNLVPDPHAAGGWSLDLSWHLEDQPDGRAELIYTGGGSAVLLTRDQADAEALVARLTRHVLQVAPGLTILAAHTRFSWDQEPLGGVGGVFAATFGTLAAAGLQQTTGPLSGLGVTLSCRSTGLPAVAFDPEEPNRPISAPTLAKVRPEVLEAADERLRSILRDPAAPQPDALDAYGFSRDFDDLGRERDDTSFIAVIHTDGNRMGERLNLVVQADVEPGPGNRRLLNDLRTFSQAVNAAGEQALRRAVRDALLPAMREPRLRRFAEGLRADDRGRPILPLRPLVFGGDDLTLVADGRLGLALATAYLTAFEEAINRLLRPPLAAIAARPATRQALAADPAGLNLLAAPITACAGIAIVKSHYPFSRAYELSAALCRSAKVTFRRESSAVDWHIASVGISGALHTLRKDEYDVPGLGDLTMRPITLAGDGWRAWPWLAELLQLLEEDEGWRERRNKVIALREALRAGPAAVRHFRIAYGLERQALPEPPDNMAELAGSGWFEEKTTPDSTPSGAARCLYFDAVELLDLYLPLRLPEVPAV